MEEAIKNFAKQFEFEPKVINAERLKPAKKFALGGMGGSHLAAGILKIRESLLDIHVHRDYGLPALSDISERLCIASSYSGNTEETLDFAKNALAQGLNLAVIATGGKLIEFAKENNLPHVIVPDTGIQPRLALGFSIKAILKIIGRDDLLEELFGLAGILSPDSLKENGKKLAESLKGKVPIIYASTKNKEITYNWKIKFNETGKIPAFANVFPELNHNEMTGFDAIETTKDLSSNFHFIFIKDDRDDVRIQKRMEVCRQLFEKKGFGVTTLSLSGDAVFERIFNSLLLADWTAYHTATVYGAESEQVPMVEEFKKLIG